MEAELREVLRRHWGHPDFRHGQLALIQASVSGQDVLGILPTGGGKSVCYQVAGLVRGGLTLVVSPLIALMADQVDALNRKGLRATFLNSTLGADEIDNRLLAAQRGEWQFLYVAPERLRTRIFVDRLASLNITLLAVDEAHCISQWGFDFRPDYRLLTQLRQQIPHVPCMAVTATATPQVRQDIQDQLHLQRPYLHTASFARPNLAFAVLYDPDRVGKLLEVVQRVQGPTIIYHRSRHGCEEVAARLRALGQTAEAYHAGMEPAARTAAQTAWMQNRTRIIVATNAFGMGIDKPDVRLIVHLALPPDLEAYYQEAGRAGRDGEKAYAVAFFRPTDETRLREEFEERFPSIQTLNKVYTAVASLAQVGVGELPPRPFNIDLRRLADVVQMAPRPLQAALGTLERAGWLRREDTGANALPRIGFAADVSEVRTLMRTNPKVADVLEHALGTLGGDSFYHALPFNPTEWAREMGTTPQALEKRLEYLAQLGTIRLFRPDRDLWARFPQPRLARLAATDLALPQQEHERTAAEARMNALLAYAKGTHICRMLAMQRYFGEAAPDDARCRKCDVCTGRHTKPQHAALPEAELAARVLEVLRRQPLGWPQMAAALPDVPPATLHRLLRNLVDSGTLAIGLDTKLVVMK